MKQIIKAATVALAAYLPLTAATPATAQDSCTDFEWTDEEHYEGYVDHNFEFTNNCSDKVFVGWKTNDIAHVTGYACEPLGASIRPNGREKSFVRTTPRQSPDINWCVVWDNVADDYCEVRCPR